jgi:hypothetical protein
MNGRARNSRSVKRKGMGKLWRYEKQLRGTGSERRREGVIQYFVYNLQHPVATEVVGWGSQPSQERNS